MKDLYKILNIDKSSTTNDIKRAYKKMAFKHHPDIGGTEENFKEISEAYEILGDEKRRNLYDKTGSVENNSASFEDMVQHFKSMFGEITTTTIRSFEKEYRGSNEEKQHVLEFLKKNIGKMEVKMHLKSHIVILKDHLKFFSKNLIKESQLLLRVIVRVLVMPRDY